jgi:hypothetical protein
MSNLYTTSIAATTQSITVCPIQPLAVSGAVISPFTAGFTYLPLLNVININPLITYAGYYNYMKAAMNMKTYSYGRKQLGNLPINGGAQPWTGGLTVPGMRLWLDGKDPLAGTTPSAGTLPTWFDKSGNGFHGVATGTPSWSTSGVSVVTDNFFTSPYTLTGNTETSFVVVSYVDAYLNILLDGTPINDRSIAIYLGNVSTSANIGTIKTTLLAIPDPVVMAIVFGG